MISRFFIDRPIFAAVLSIVITLAGAVSVLTLPLAQFPAITPPTVQVTANYPGASAKEVADELAGIEAVGDVFLVGERDYSMRVWVNTDERAVRSLTAGYGVKAIREQNNQVATGSIGQEQTRGRQSSQVTLSTLGRLE